MLIFSDMPEPRASCPCGSGKQFRKCHKKKYLRLIKVEIPFVSDTSLTRVSLHKSTGDITLHSANGKIAPTAVKWKAGYQGANRFKHVAQFDLPSDQATIDPVATLRKFDNLYAVDTNSQNIAGRRFSITVAVKADVSQEESCVKLAVRLVVEEGFVTSHDPEKFGWFILLQDLASVCQKSGLPCGVVVDHDMQNLPRYNRGEVPILPGFFVPEGVQLIYATENALGTAYNQLIRCCHKRSSAIFTEERERILATLNGQ